MRWQFADPTNPHEQAHRAEVLRRIDDWWRAFEHQAGDLDAAFARKGGLDVPRFMADHLHPVDGRLCWEFGPAINGAGHRLVITPEGERSLTPMVRTLLERAPELPGWEFYPYRLPESVEMAHATVRGRCGGFEAPDATVRLSRGRHNLIDVTFRSAAFPPAVEAEETNERARSAAFVFAETLFGEEALDHWVGVIEAEPAPKPGIVSRLLRRGGDAGRFLPLDRAKPTFDALVASVRDQLPDRPMSEMDLTGDHHPWTNYELRRDEDDATDAADWPGRQDVFIGGTAFMDLTEAATAPGFHSGRFSRFGETFCYVKLDRGDTPRQQWVEWRSVFADAVDPALRDAGCGCLFGAATGAAYSYLDLALSDVARGVDVVRSVLRGRGAPVRSWLMFFDPAYAAEWVGMWDQTPPPP